MACLNLLIINIILVVSVKAVNNVRPGFQQFTVPLPPSPFYGRIQIPIIRVPLLPTVDQIKNTIPRPGQLYNGVYAQSSSGFVRDKDGKLVNIGRTHVVTNDNGKIKEYNNFRG